MPRPDAAAIERVFREEYGRAVAILVRHFKDLDLAEDAVQDAFTKAVARWPASGIPPSPVGWIVTTARNRLIDRLRREAGADATAQVELAFRLATGRPPSSKEKELAIAFLKTQSLKEFADFSDLRVDSRLNCDSIRTAQLNSPANSLSDCTIESYSWSRFLFATSDRMSCK